MWDTDEMHRHFAQNQSVDYTGKVLGSILMSVSLSTQRKFIEVERVRHQQSIFPGTMECAEHNAELRWMRPSVEANAMQHCFIINIKMWERRCRVILTICWRTRDSNASILKSKDAVNDREEHLNSKIHDDENRDNTGLMRRRQNQIVNKIDATRCELVDPRQVGFYRSSETFGQWSSQWASFVNSNVPRKRAVRDLVAQIWNHTWKSEAPIQSETTLNAGDTKNYSTDQLEARHQGEKELRKYWKDANHCFCAVMLFKSPDWYYTRPWIPHSTWKWRLTKLVMNLVKGCSLDAHRGLDMCTEIRCRLGDTSTETETDTRNRNRQPSVLIVNVETDAQTELNQGKVERFEALLTMNGSWQQWAKQEQSKSNKQYDISWILPRAQWRARMTGRADAFSGPGCDGTWGGGRFDTLKLERFELADVLSSAFDSRILHQKAQSAREEECWDSSALSTMPRPCTLSQPWSSVASVLILTNCAHSVNGSRNKIHVTWHKRHP